MHPIRNGFFCLATLTALAAPQATPGQWEISSKMTMNGMAMPMPMNSIKYCMKPADASNLERHAMPGPQGQQNKDCKMLEHSVSGDTVKFHMRCEGKHAADMHGEVSYGANSYKGRTEIDTEGGPKGKMHMTNEFSAKRLGDC